MAAQEPSKLLVRVRSPSPASTDSAKYGPLRRLRVSPKVTPTATRHCRRLAERGYAHGVGRCRGRSRTLGVTAAWPGRRTPGRASTCHELFDRFGVELLVVVQAVAGSSPVAHLSETPLRSRVTRGSTSFVLPGSRGLCPHYPNTRGASAGPDRQATARQRMLGRRRTKPAAENVGFMGEEQSGDPPGASVAQLR
jgi:hypothetical protein